MPKLLVSVRNRKEAEAALVGQCDWLDIKEPLQGSLGMAPVSAIEAIVQRVEELESVVPVSAALGELHEWTEAAGTLQLPAGLSHVKLGLAGAMEHSNWQQAWYDVRERVQPSSENRNAGEVGWIAVAYADWRIARAPHPNDVLAFAQESQCDGLLVDTFTKDGSQLFDWLSHESLARLSKNVREASMLFAVAGSLQPAQFPNAVFLQPDIVAVRTAACRNQERNADITAEAVSLCKQRLTAAASVQAALSTVSPEAV